MPRPDRPVGPLGRLVSSVSHGVRTSTGQVDAYAEHWDAHNALVRERLLGTRDRWWVVLGDSTAQGVGATTPDGGWAGQLMASRGVAWFNLSVSGATTRDLVEIQLGVLAGLTRELGAPELALVAVGANDVFRSPRPMLFRRAVAAISAAFEPGRSVIATVPQAPFSMMGAMANSAVRGAAQRRNHAVADVNERYRAPYRGMVAPDRFHPNERGYAAWAAAFEAAIAARCEPVGVTPR